MIHDDEKCHGGYWPPSGAHFRLLTTTDVNAEYQQDVGYQYRKTFGDEPEVISTAQNPVSYASSLKGGIEVVASSAFSVSADLHILSRTTNFNPVAELWASGNLSLSFDGSFMARVWARGEWNKVFTLMPEICAICFPAKLGPVGLRIGVLLSIQAQLEAMFEAELRLEYARKVTQVVSVSAHTRGS